MKKIIDKSYLAFKKIRMNKFYGIDNELIDLFKMRKELRKMVNTAKYKREEPNENNIIKLKETEEKISKVVARNNWDKINGTLKAFTNVNNSLNITNMWRKFKRNFSNKMSQPPTGVKNHKNKIITDIKEIKEIYIRKFTHRMRKRPFHPMVRNLLRMKEENCRKIIETAKDIKTPP